MQSSVPLVSIPSHTQGKQNDSQVGPRNRQPFLWPHRKTGRRGLGGMGCFHVPSVWLSPTRWAATLPGSESGAFYLGRQLDITT
jgi:hypothetical protein